MQTWMWDPKCFYMGLQTTLCSLVTIKSQKIVSIWFCYLLIQLKRSILEAMCLAGNLILNIPTFLLIFVTEQSDSRYNVVVNEGDRGWSLNFESDKINPHILNWDYPQTQRKHGGMILRTKLVLEVNWCFSTFASLRWMGFNCQNSTHLKVVKTEKHWWRGTRLFPQSLST